MGGPKIKGGHKVDEKKKKSHFEELLEELESYEEGCDPRSLHDGV